MSEGMTTHVNDYDGLGRMPKVFYAVKFKGTHPETGRKKTYIYTFDRMPSARRHAEQLEKLGGFENVELLKGDVEWQPET